MRKYRKAYCLLILLLLGMSPMTCTLQALELVRNGKAKSVIVIGEKASPAVRNAAQELQKHLYLLTGVDLAIVSDEKHKDLHNKNVICVGESRLTKKAAYKKPHFSEGVSAYEVLIRDRHVILNGPVTSYRRIASPYEKGFHEQGQSGIFSGPESVLTTDNGVMHAVSAFLEKLGVRFYAPGKGGTFYPHTKDVVVKDSHIVKTASFPIREYHFTSGAKADQETLSYLQMLKCGSARYRVGVLPLSDVMKHDPTFPRAKMRDGREIISLDGYGVPLYSHKGFRKACVERLRKIFDADKNLNEVQIIYPSAKGRYDADEVKAYTVKPHYPQCSPSNGIDVDFHKALALELAKTHPGKKLLYTTNRLQRIEERIMKGIPPALQGSPSAVTVHAYGSKARYLKELRHLTGTLGGGRGFQKEFWNEFDSNQIPRQGFFLLKALQEVRRVQKDHLHGVSMVLPYDSRRKTLAEKELYSLMLYVNSKLLWDPDLDLEKLLSEYFLHNFGQAKNIMRNFYAYGEHVYTRGRSRGITERNSCLQKKDAAVFFELLRQAKEQVSPRSIFYKRIGSLEKELLWMKEIFQNIIPRGEPLEGEIIAWDTPCDGNLSKYKKFYPLSHGPLQGNKRTEFAVAAREDRSTFVLAVRCYEPDMKSLNLKKWKDDSPQIRQEDHIRILFRCAYRGPFEVIVSAGGSLLDGTFDPNLFRGNTSYWNSPVHKSTIRYYRDRWELEIPFGNIGVFPDWYPAWGLRIERVRIRDGKSEMASNCKGSSFEMANWSKLTIPKVNSKGEEMVGRDCVLRKVNKIPNGVIYRIRKAKKKVTFSISAWNDPETWGSAPEAFFGNELFFYNRTNKAGYRPEPSFKMLYDDKFLYVFYKVRDRYVRGSMKKDQEMVCLDSCMELFIMPNGKGKYFNFEMNCLGTLLLYQVTPAGNRVQMKAVPLEELQKIKRFHSLPRTMSGEKVGDTVWYAALQIPMDFFMRYTKVTLPLEGQVWTGNVYKCADWSSHPCWLTWNKTRTFHDVDGFGTFIFE